MDSDQAAKIELLSGLSLTRRTYLHLGAECRAQKTLPAHLSTGHSSSGEGHSSTRACCLC